MLACYISLFLWLGILKLFEEEKSTALIGSSCQRRSSKNSEEGAFRDTVCEISVSSNCGEGDVRSEEIEEGAADFIGRWSDDGIDDWFFLALLIDEHAPAILLVVLNLQKEREINF